MSADKGHIRNAGAAFRTGGVFCATRVILLPAWEKTAREKHFTFNTSDIWGTGHRGRQFFSITFGVGVGCIGLFYNNSLWRIP